LPLPIGYADTLACAKFLTHDGIVLEFAQILFAVAVVAAAVLVGLWHRYCFIVRLKAGSPRIVKGVLTAAFLDEVAGVCREAGIRRGWLGGVRRGKRLVLSFSWHFPAPIRQRLRNIWAIHA
jgi:hypothetical protein